jgi:hypothetical protein
MKLEDLDPKKDEYTEEELSGFVEILIKAEQIKADSMLYRLVQKHMKRQKKKIDSVADLRDRLSEKEAMDEAES